MADTAKKPETYIELVYGKQTVRIPLGRLIARLEPSLPVESMPDEVRLGIDRNGTAIHATVSPQENQYPGLTVDGYAPLMESIWLGNFELPCPTYPSRIAARLYAGCSDYETDSPIVLVTHDVKTKDLIERRIKGHQDLPPMTKLIYVDRDLAAERPWTGAYENNLPEHKEDE